MPKIVIARRHKVPKIVIARRHKVPTRQSIYQQRRRTVPCLVENRPLSCSRNIRTHVSRSEKVSREQGAGEENLIRKREIIYVHF